MLTSDEIKNPQDKVDEHRKKAEEIVHAHFDKTDKVIFYLKAQQNVVLQELNAVKSKLEEGNMRALRPDYYKLQEAQLSL